MGIVAYCPNGHRVKVKDEFAGRKGVCPECQARFRIPRGDAAGGGAARRAEGYRVARVVSLDPAVAAGLPRAVAVAPTAGAPGSAQVGQPAAPRAAAVGAGGGVQVGQPAPPGADAAARQGGQPAARTSLHPALAERPELTWSVEIEVTWIPTAEPKTTSPAMISASEPPLTPSATTTLPAAMNSRPTSTGRR